MHESEDVTDEVSLGSALRRLRLLRAGRDRVLRLAAAERARVAAWEERRTRTLNERIAVVESQVESFALRARLGGVKTVDVPDGVVRTREVPGRVVVRDVPAFEGWAVAHDPGLLRTVVSVDARAVGDRVKRDLLRDAGGVVVDVDGVVVPGAVFVEGSVSVSIDVDGVGDGDE